MPADVLNKRDYYLRWQNLEFGNKLRSWATIYDIAPYSGLVTMRHLIPTSKLTRFEVHVDDILKEAEDDLCNYRFNESAPDHLLLAQGEVCYMHNGWHLTWSREQTNMRRAMSICARVAQGLTAREILKHYCDSSSYADIESLVELYPCHVIEFGCYKKNLGDVPYRNTIIWEVRKY